MENQFKKVTKEMREELRKPLPQEAIKPHPTKTYLSSIKAIYVTERLNDVFGIGSWKLKTDIIPNIEINKGMVVVKTTIEIPEYNIYIESFGGNDNGGEGSKNFDLGDAFKGATTDAITKICSYLEIGIDVFKGKVSAAKTAAPTKTPPPPASKPSTAQVAINSKGGLVPNENFDKPIEVYPDGFLDDLEKMASFEDLLEINKKYKNHLGDESLKIIMSKKMNDAFAKLPASEQNKYKAKKS